MPRRGFFRAGLQKIAKAAADALEESMDRVRHEFQEHHRDAPVRPVAPSRSGPPPRMHGSDRLEYSTRPPGAVEGDRFFELCTKCGDCVEACPAWAIRSADAHDANPGFPIVEPNISPCSLCSDPVPCIAACGTGALVATPRTEIDFGLAVVDFKTCIVPLGEHCDYCVLYCPLESAAIRMTGDGPEIIEGGCTGCGSCVQMCPTSAITVVPRVRPRSVAQ
ncbi:MAG: 4Fe-4S dicluster domain-containing protein [Planctomycetes bacterium]|nr:4Fe-4S dicluster domain-containing protein [Planctomycetota bacterium]